MRKRYKESWRSITHLLVLLLTFMLLNARAFNSTTAHAAIPEWVTRSGSQLLMGGTVFRFAGANIYWLGLDEGAQSYPTPFRIDDALKVAREMGTTVVRSHSLGVSTGCALCVEPSLGNFNTTALTHIDYAISQASAYGLHLIIPLTDNYHFYHGGKHNFTDWRGIADENQFYTNPVVIGDFERYISVLLNHVNTYTGVAYKDDPTIMAWETGNELLPPSSWTRQIADYIKSIDSNHLVMDGNYGIDPTSLPSVNVDIYSDHLYPPNIARMNNDAAQTQSAGKALIIGEYDWETASGDSLSSFLSAVLNNGAVSGGDLFWDIWPHSDTAGYLGLKDAINLHYPGDTADRRDRIQVMRTHGFAMSGLSVPPDSVPDAPLITSIQGNRIFWRGAPIGDTYSIERSSVGDSGPWSIVCDRCVTDYTVPWTDATQPTTTIWYRIRAYNRVGVPGPYSPVAQASNAFKLVDNLDGWSLAYSHSANLHFDTSNPANFNGDTSRAFRWSVSTTPPDEIVWHVPGMKTVTALTYFWPGEPISHFSFFIADDTLSWTQVFPTATVGTGNWIPVTYTINGLWNATYVKIRWNNLQGQSWSPQLGQISIG